MFWSGFKEQKAQLPLWKDLYELQRCIEWFWWNISDFIKIAISSKLWYNKTDLSPEFWNLSMFLTSDWVEKTFKSSEIISIWFTTIELPWKLLLLLVIYIVASPLSFLCWCFPKLFIMICEGQRVHIFNSHLRRSLRKVIRESTRRAAKNLIVVSEKTKLTWLTG